ncbi:DAK2 domain-containing protein [Cellulomonas denverensis]|uniref:DAK2 domain-containing protein n=1 Tax=Cellulomonas denverensis TaxID=264297 RepID=A0A7X6KXS7_9CELL|nr:DAK2 domain-containing protein [Cellulomonas denverensis]NKY24168.1 DAK2 domain-containing protein [Cellulomonas denverensis]GIG25346.1 hypothetical protein Cde04nite_15900 [Cellulomonas denverensis]
MVGRLLDGPVLRRWLVRAAQALEQAGPRIDAVNVFPVADQDTGTNCLLTLRGAVEEVAALDPAADGPAVLAAATRGSLLAARGNSGMILSHWFAGLARGAAEGVVPALAAAARSARSAVLAPEDGTVLDLAAEVARAAGDARRGEDGDAGGLPAGAAADEDREALASALAAGQDALAAISGRHPVLRDARVLDAGACALLVVLAAWVAAADETLGAPGTLGAEGPDATGDLRLATALDLSWLPESAPAALPERGMSGFEVMAVLPAGDDDALRARLASIGDSVAVVAEPGDGPGRLRQSHVHTADPAAAVAVVQGAADPEPVLVVVEALDGRTSTAVAVTGSPERVPELARCGAVVLVAGPGVPAGRWRPTLDRAVRDARAGGAHRVPDAVHGGDAAPAHDPAPARDLASAPDPAPAHDPGPGADPVPVLPGAWAGECAAALPPGATLIAEADDEDRVLAVVRALAGEVPA